MLLSQIYLWMMLLGGGLILVSFIFGDMAEWFGDVMEGAFESIGGLFDSVDMSVGDLDASDGGRVGFNAILAFVTFFGTAGFFSMNAYGASEGMSFIFALVTGVFMGALFGWIMRFMSNQQGSSHVRPEDIVGKKGRVILTIPYEGYGKVSMTIHGMDRSFPAQSKDGSEIREGTIVTVDHMGGVYLIVSK